jgi:hypothetical protein
MKMKVLTLLLLLISILCACVLSACKHTVACGTWAFSGDVQGTGTGSAFPISSAFTFNPANCGGFDQQNVMDDKPEAGSMPDFKIWQNFGL